MREGKFKITTDVQREAETRDEEKDFFSSLSFYRPWLQCIPMSIFVPIGPGKELELLWKRSL